MEKNNHPPLHPLVTRQLKRANLSQHDIAAGKQEEWSDFLKRVSKSFEDCEQERYLLERSMEISSREMMDLNNKFEFANEIAHLGYWIYEPAGKKVTWSKELFNISGIDVSEDIPSFADTMNLVHENDREFLLKLINQALKDGKDYTAEIRLKNIKSGKYIWIYVKGHPHSDKENNQSTRYISGIAIDITERKVAEENTKKLQEKLLDTSRQAGMAEVATSILHNVGNILNSASVSITLCCELIKKSRVNRLVEVSKIINEHISVDDHYFIQDEKGKLIPKYLEDISKLIFDDYNKIANEMKNIDLHLSHVREIISLQNDISRAKDFKQEVILTDLTDMAIQMSNMAENQNNIKIVKHYLFNQPILVEKSKLLQIIVNLIRNAKEAVMIEHSENLKSITVTIERHPSKDNVLIKIEDNGKGIPSEQLNKIFAFGFTTKPRGHGYGLHSSALNAKELGGELRVESLGLGLGATFIIELPIILSKQAHQQVVENADNKIKVR